MRRKTKAALSSWLAALNETAATAGKADGMTSEQIAAECGVSTSTVRRRILKPLMLTDRLIVGRAMQKQIDGSVKPVPVYRIK